MVIAAIGSFRELVEIVVTGVSILGGFMAFYSGLEARRSIRIGAEPEQVAFRINRGLAGGFNIGLPAALFAATLLAFV